MEPTVASRYVQNIDPRQDKNLVQSVEMRQRLDNESLQTTLPNIDRLAW